MAQTRFQVLEEVYKESDDGWRLCLQWGRYIYENRKIEQGFRFIWRDEKTHLRPQRAQACIISLDIAEKLISEARNKGWGNNEGGYI